VQIRNDEAGINLDVLLRKRNISETSKKSKNLKMSPTE